MSELGLNPWAIMPAAGSTFLIGGRWYSPVLFERPWREATGLPPQALQGGSPARIFGGAFVLALVMAANLAAFLAGPPNVVWGMTAGALAGAGWVATALGVIYLFERRPLKLFLVIAGYQVVAFVVMGASSGRGSEAPRVHSPPKPCRPVSAG
jgi:hypothetical protein